MQVNGSCYYAYVGRKTFRQSRWTMAVKECFDLNRRRYGSRRIAASLKIGRATVQKVMRRENLRAIQPRSFTPQTTDSKHGLPVSRQPVAERDECASRTRRSVRRRHHISAAGGRRVLLSGVFAGQIYTKNCLCGKFHSG